MADLNVTATGVLATNSNTVTATGYSAVPVVAGQVLYLDTNALLRPAQAGTIALQSTGVVGIALNSVQGSNQLVTYATAGSVVLPTSGAGTMVNGAVYLVSTVNAGSLVSATDTGAPAPGTFVTPVGIAVNLSTLFVNIAPVLPTGAVR